MGKEISGTLQPLELEQGKQNLQLSTLLNSVINLYQVFMGMRDIDEVIIHPKRNARGINMVLLDFST